MDDSATLSFSLTPSDYVRAVRARQTQLGLWWRQALIAAVVATAVLPMVFAATEDCGCGSRRTWIVVGAWATVFILFTGLFRLVSSSPIKRLVKANPDFLGPIEVRLTAEGFHESKPLIETFRRWPAFTGWHDGDAFLFLFLGQGADGQFLVLPRASATPEQWQRAREILLAQLGPPTS